MYKGRWGLRVKGHVEIIRRGEFSSHADSKYKLIKTLFWEKYRASAGNRTSDHLDEMAIDIRSTGQSTAPQTPRISVTGEARISISELGQVIFVTAYSWCTEIARSRFPSRSFDRPSSHRLDLGLRIIKGKSLVFRLCTKVTGGYGSETTSK